MDELLLPGMIIEEDGLVITIIAVLPEKSFYDLIAETTDSTAYGE